ESYTPARCAAIGQLLEDGLHALAQKYPLIGEVRGRGLMQGVELVADRQSKTAAPQHANAVMEAARNTGVLIGKGGMYGNTLRIPPPLMAPRGQDEKARDKLD